MNRTKEKKDMIIKKCPKCNDEYTEKPALSRVDSKTEICQWCGMIEAIVIAETFIENKNIKLKTNKLTTMEKKYRDKLIPAIEIMRNKQKVAEK